MITQAAPAVVRQQNRLTLMPIMLLTPKIINSNFQNRRFFLHIIRLDSGQNCGLRHVIAMER
jgi:hypothetical protein